MTKKFSLLALSTAMCVLASNASADLVTISQLGGSGVRTRGVTAAESGAASQPAPADGDVYQFRVTTDGDILSVNNLLITLQGGATLFQNTFGDPGDSNKPTPGLEAAFPSITADTWIDTPGVGSRVGGAPLPGDGLTTIGDTTNDGPVTDFIWAQLTVPKGTIGTFAGRISIAGGGGTTVFNQEFNLPLGIPEPASLAMAGLGLIGMMAMRRRIA